MIKQIVIGIDGSMNSFYAFDCGISLAQKISGSIKVVFVVDDRKTAIPIVYTGGSYEISYERIYIPPDPELQRFYRKMGEDLKIFAANCINTCKKRAKENNISIVTEIKKGYPAEVLCEEARSGDILIIGQRGENAHFKRMVVGSTAEDLVRSSPRPVLICPYNEKKPDITRVLFPYDGSSSSENALQFYVNAAQGFADDFIMMSVGEKDYESTAFEEELAYLNKHEIIVSVIYKKGSPIHAVLEAVEEKEYDLILVGKHGRNKIKEYILGSTTSNLVRKSHIPVLIV